MPQRARPIGPAFMLALLVTLAVLATPPARACTPQISVVEELADPNGGGGQRWRYRMSTGELCGWQLVALAVDNKDSLAAFANLAGWNALLVNDAFWDAGMVLSRDDFGTGSSYQFLTGPQGIGSFLSFFGPAANLANVYWLSRHYGGPVVDHSTAFTATGTPIPLPDDAFEFETRAPASLPLVFLHNPNSGDAQVISLVPEPAAWLLLLLGGLGLRLRPGPSACRR